MNCFYHPSEPAVSSCMDCGKGLCQVCTTKYEMPICNECNLKRVQGDKGNIVRIYLPSVLLFSLGIFIGISMEGFTLGLGLGYIFAGIPWGWKVVTFIQPRMFLFLSFIGWVFYFVIKLGIAGFVGLIALPIGLIKLIISIVITNKKENDIKNNMMNN